MTNAAATTILAHPKAGRGNLTDALRQLDRYSGKVDGTLICRLGIKALRAYAQAVHAELTAVVVPAPVVEPKPATEPKARKASSRQVANDAVIITLVDLGRPATKTDLAAAAGKAVATYWTPSGWAMGNADKQPATWNPYYMAAIRCGYEAIWNADRTVSLQALTEEDATAQEEGLAAAVAAYKVAKAARKLARPAVSASVTKARTAPVSTTAVAKLTAAIAAAQPDQSGTLIITALDLAMAGLGATWASTPNSHLADADHVKARTLAALGYTGRTKAGLLALTPMADEGADSAVA